MLTSKSFACVLVLATSALALVTGLLDLGGAMTAFAASGIAVGMIVDERTEFADATAMDTGGTGLALVGDVLDSSVARNVGNSGLFLVITIDTTFTSGGAATVEFLLASDAAAAIAVDGTASVHAKTKAFALAELVAGNKIIVPLPPEADAEPYERYIGILQNVGTAALTAGKINAFLTTTPKSWKAVADGI